MCYSVFHQHYISTCLVRCALYIQLITVYTCASSCVIPVFMFSQHLIACFFSNNSMFPWHIWGNKYSQRWFIDTEGCQNAMLCLRCHSNWIRAHSLMTLLWLVNNMMIKVLQTWQEIGHYDRMFLTWIQMNSWSSGHCFSVVTWR